jgi:4-carboxymuconolactone decarboxylase
MPRITVPTEMTAEQKPVAERIAKALGVVGGPYSAWIHRPELASRIFDLHDYFRNEAAIPGRLRLLAVLLTIRHWGADYAWSVQVPHALGAGLSLAIVAAVGEGKTPSFTDPDEAVVYHIATELLERRAISDATYQQALDRLGQPALIELVAVIGHFSLICLTAIAFDIPPTKNPAVPLRKN